MVKLIERITKREGREDSSSFSLTIPKTYVEKLGWKKGDDIEVAFLTSYSLKLQSLNDILSPDSSKATYSDRIDIRQREQLGKDITNAPKDNPA